MHKKSFYCKTFVPSWYKKHGLETYFDVIVSDCALKSVVFCTRIPKLNYWCFEWFLFVWCLWSYRSFITMCFISTLLSVLVTPSEYNVSQMNFNVWLRCQKLHYHFFNQCCCYLGHLCGLNLQLLVEESSFKLLCPLKCNFLEIPFHSTSRNISIKWDDEYLILDTSYFLQSW